MGLEQAGNDELWRSVLEKYADKFTKSAGKAASRADVEDVHKARVNIRKLLAVMKLLDADDAEGYQKPMRRAMKALGKIRDRDVLIEEFTKRKKAVLNDDSSDMLKRFVKLQKKKRKESRVKLERKLHPVARNKFRKRWQAFLDGGLTTYAGKANAQGAFRRLEKEMRDNRRRFGELRKSSGTVDAAALDALHQARLNVKELRYLIDGAGFALDASTLKKTGNLERLQETIGNVIDCRVWLEAWNRSKPEELGARAELHEEMAEVIRAEMEDRLEKI